MFAKKLLFCSILGAATLFSTASFASYHSHYNRPRMQFNHHHHNTWRNVHRWGPRRNHIVVPARNPYPRTHYHY